jgi:hypothetical protein
MEFYQIVVQRLEAIAHDDDLQCESILNTEFMDSEKEKQENKLVIQTLANRAEGIRKIATVIEAKGLNDLVAFRQLIIKKFFNRGYTPLSGTFYLEVDRLITTLETLINMGVTSIEGREE